MSDEPVFRGNSQRLRGEVTRSIADVYRRSIEEPEAFWAYAAAGIDWVRSSRRIRELQAPHLTRWFPDGLLNTCYNAVDRHVLRGRAEQRALVYESPVTRSRSELSYKELLDLTARFSGVLTDLGVARGDVVLIYMPVIPEAVIAMLACARIGAPHAVVFGGFAAPELASRIDAAKPKVVISASCGIEYQKVIPYKPILDKALALAAHDVQRCVIVQRPGVTAELRAGRDVDWKASIESAAPVDCVPVGALEPLYILYTSGTTANPKGIVRDNGGHAVALRWSMSNIFDSPGGDVFWAASDIGWVVGHSYMVYGPLLNGCTTVLYEGKPVGTPDAGSFWRVISQHGVRTLFTAPTALRAIRKEDPEGRFMRKVDLSSLRYLFLAGERLDPATYVWATELLGVPVVDNWWQTETGWPIAGNCMGIAPKSMRAGSPTAAIPGYDVRVLRANGEEAGRGEEGSLVVRLPLPPGTMTGLWKDEERFRTAYFTQFPGYYSSGDGGFIDEDGYLFVMGRTDDVINVSGHRLSTGAIEEVLASHEDVAECAVIGMADPLKGQIPIGFVVLKTGCAVREEVVCQQLIELVRETIGAVVGLKRVYVVSALPRTRSGKVLRATMRAIAEGEIVVAPATIEDPLVLEEIRGALKPSG